MKELLNLTLLLFVIFSCSCSTKLGKDGEQLEVKSTPGYFLQHFEPHSFVPIETNDSLLLSDIDRVISVDGDYLLLSRNAHTVVLLDGSSGQSKTVINEHGMGPGEYNRIIDMAFDAESRRILIYCDYSKLMFYDLNGRFLSDMKVEDSYENILCRRGEVYFYGGLEGYSCKPFLLKKYNLRENVWTDLGDDKVLEFPMRIKGRQIVESRGVWFNSPLDFSLYSLADDGYSSTYEIGYSKSALNDRLMKSAVENPLAFMQEVNKEHIVYSINSVRELDDFVVYRTNLMDLCLLDKNEKVVYSDEFLSADFFNLSSSDYFPHDGDDGLVMFVLSAEKYVEGLELLKTYSRELDERFVFEGLKEDDNPLLVFFRPQ